MFLTFGPALMLVSTFIDASLLFFVETLGHRDPGPVLSTTRAN
jgi:hypothetical protein